MSVKIVSVIANLKTTIHGGLTKPVESVKMLVSVFTGLLP